MEDFIDNELFPVVEKAETPRNLLDRLRAGKEAVHLRLQRFVHEREPNYDHVLRQMNGGSEWREEQYILYGDPVDVGEVLARHFKRNPIRHNEEPEGKPYILKFDIRNQTDLAAFDVLRKALSHSGGDEQPDLYDSLRKQLPLSMTLQFTQARLESITQNKDTARTTDAEKALGALGDAYQRLKVVSRFPQRDGEALGI